jgi:hypothetical protein
VHQGSAELVASAVTAGLGRRRARRLNRAAFLQTSSLRRFGPPALIAITVGQAVLEHGGFSTTARILFASLAALAALAALLAGGRAAVRAARHPLAGVLLCLAALGAISGLWTVGLQEDALVWALLPAGYGFLVIAAIAAPDAQAVRSAVLLALCVCAFISGLVGLLGVATFSDPQAFRPVVAWRPAGTLEYSPALALLEVCALAPLLRALCSRGRIAWVAATPALVAGAVLGLSHSRLGVALAALVLAGLVAAPRLTLRASRREALAAVALVLVGGVAARAVLGGAVPLGAEAPDWRVAAVLGGCVCAAAAWAAIRWLGRRVAPTVLACIVAGLIAGGAEPGFEGSLVPQATVPAAAVVPPQLVRHRTPGDHFLHGRRDIWSAGVEAFGRRPLEGHGAASFLSATLRLQHRPATTYAHALPLELAVELGMAGLLLAIGLYLIPIRACWRARRSGDAWLLIIPVLAFLAANLVDWPWHIAGVGAVWAATAGALIGAGFAEACSSADGPLGRGRAPSVGNQRR